MPDTDPRVDAFLARATAWRAEMAALRAMVLDCGLTEDFKWGKPCYTVGGRNVLIIAGLKHHCWVAFFKGALLNDPLGLLERPGDNTHGGRVVKFTGTGQIAVLDAGLRDLVLQAVAAERAGVPLPARDAAQDTYPPELTDRLDADPALRIAFEALSPGRRRAYVLHFAQPKQAATRAARIEKWAPEIRRGKGMNDR